MLARSIAEKVAYPARRVRHKLRSYPETVSMWSLPSGRPLNRPIRMHLHSGSDLRI